jgi:hypothetical protein
LRAVTRKIGIENIQILQKVILGPTANWIQIGYKCTESKQK